MTPVMFTNGCEIQFYPNLTPAKSSLALLEAQIPSPLQTTQKDKKDCFFGDGAVLCGGCCFSCRYGVGGGDGGQDGAI